MLNFLTTLVGTVKTPVGKWVTIGVVTVLLLGFGTQLPIVQDLIVSVKSFKAFWDRRGWEKDIQAMQHSMDSTQAVVSEMKASSDSLAIVISDQNTLLRKRGRSIDSINGAIKHLDSLRKAQTGKEIRYEDIKDHGRFVDSMLAYRDSVLASKHR